MDKRVSRVVRWLDEGHVGPFPANVVVTSLLVVSIGLILAALGFELDGAPSGPGP